MRRAKWPRVPFIELVGAIPEESDEGYARLTLLLEERHMNPRGVAHGGVATTLMDSAAAMALSSLRRKVRETGRQATVEMNASLIAPARRGDELIVEGRVLSLRRRVAFCESEVRRKSDNELIAKGRFTFAISTGKA